MKRTSWKTSLNLYSLFLLAILFSIWKGFFSAYEIYWAVFFLVLIIRDITLFFYSPHKIPSRSLDVKKIFSDYINNRLDFSYFFGMLNRNYFFPFFLILYLLILLNSQIDIFLFGWEKYQNIFLIFVILSGILTLFGEKYELKYISMGYSRGKEILFFGSTLFFSLGACIIVFLQTEKLGYISFFISVLSGLIIFLVGLSLLEEGEENIS